MSIASDVDDASEQYNLYRLLNNDEYISVNVTGVYGTKNSYYVEVTTTRHNTILVFIRLPRVLNDTDNAVSASPLQLLGGAFTERNDEIRVTDCELRINPEFDTEANRSGDVMVKTQTDEFELEMLTSLPESATELSFEEKHALQWKSNVVAWYQNTNRDGRVETTIQHRVDGEERQSLANTEVDDRFLTVSDEVIRADGQTTATFQLVLGEERTTMSFCIPPDGRRPDVVSEFIESCGGTLDSVENVDVVLFPYGDVPGCVFDSIGGEEEVLTTDNGLFAVVTAPQFQHAKYVHSQKIKKQSVIEGVKWVLTLSVMAGVGYGVIISIGAMNEFLLSVFGYWGRNVIGGFIAVVTFDMFLKYIDSQR